MFRFFSARSKVIAFLDIISRRNSCLLAFLDIVAYFQPYTLPIFP